MLREYVYFYLRYMWSSVATVTHVVAAAMGTHALMYEICLCMRRTTTFRCTKQESLEVKDGWRADMDTLLLLVLELVSRDSCLPDRRHCDKRCTLCSALRAWSDVTTLPYRLNVSALLCLAHSSHL